MIVKYNRPKVVGDFKVDWNVQAFRALPNPLIYVYRGCERNLTRMHSTKMIVLQSVVCNLTIFLRRIKIKLIDSIEFFHKLTFVENKNCKLSVLPNNISSRKVVSIFGHLRITKVFLRNLSLHTCV